MLLVTIHHKSEKKILKCREHLLPKIIPAKHKKEKISKQLRETSVLISKVPQISEKLHILAKDLSHQKSLQPILETSKRGATYYNYQNV
jgi:hypothetical protein